MESYQIEHLTFTYPNQSAPALDDISLTVPQGQFITLCGKSGCGKSTLLRQLKSALAPHGERRGSILFMGAPLHETDERTQSARIGFVLQSPENQIVTDKVWHELAFGLESLGYSTPEIRARVAEMASFFGIQTWFHKKVTELSGGQKQLLNLAAVMAMQPSVLILDEPTSQLDPIAAQDFLETIAKINRELGTTVLLTEHRLEEAFPMSDRVLVMDKGKIIADGTPKEVGEALKGMAHDMFVALPAPMRVYAGVKSGLECPITVREGRKWLEKLAETQKIDAEAIPPSTGARTGQPVLELKEIWFRYQKELPDVVKGLSATVCQGELYAIVGGNGTGKTTTLSIINGLLRPVRGQVLLNGAPLDKVQDKYNGLLGVLPQNPQALFVKKTVELDLYEMLADRKMPKQERAARVNKAAQICELEHLLQQHPYDLSGGEQQRAALAKVLLLDPKILLLDEPTKGLDAYFKETFAGILNDLKSRGVTIVMVSHDIEFCAKHADRCAMFFDGTIVSEGSPREFFSGKSFYTTAVNRMARTVLPNAVLAEDVIVACGGTPPLPKRTPPTGEGALFQEVEKEAGPSNFKPKLTVKRVVWGSIFGALFLLILLLFYGKFSDWRNYLVQGAAVLALALCLFHLIPQQPLDTAVSPVQIPKGARRLSKRTLAAAAMILLAIPLTIYIGIYFLGDRKYYFISLLIILETMVPFCMVFEHRKPQARELVIISVLCAIAVAGRVAFYMLPQFKPVVALVIITGVCFGGEAGFLVGAVTGFVSNFYFGQGPLTPWQMFAFGIIGFVAGILFRKGWLRKTRGALVIFGALATFLIYGGIMNPASVLMWQAKPNAAMFVSAYLMGIPFDLVHAAATAFFLWFLSGPMIEKLDRIKIKYGLLEQ